MHSVWNEEPEWNEPLWRYMTTERFEWMLEKSLLFFASANQFVDPFEGAVAVIPPEYQSPVDPRYADDLDLGEKAFRQLKRLTKINCWHRADYESDLMWRLYAEESKGVAICSTPARIRAACHLFRLSPNFGHEDLWYGDVRYVDLLKVRLRDAGMLERFFAKHLVFSLEKEFRLAISVRMAEEFGVPVPELGISVTVDLDALIDRIVLGPALAPKTRDELSAAVHAAGLGAKLTVSSMLGQPRYT